MNDPAVRYRLLKRKIGKKRIFYARFLDDDGNVVRTLSTKETNQYRAHDWCRDHIKQEQERAEREAERQQHITVAELAIDFWDLNGRYAQSRIARGYSISNTHLEISEGYTRNHILPRWANCRVADLTSGVINAWVLDLHKDGDLAPGTINKILCAFRAMLDGAVLRDFLKDNPASAVKPLKPYPKERGVLTDAEITLLLAGPDPWVDFRHYAINLLAFHTGARIGEIRGLTIDHVKPDRIEIVQAWEEGHGPKDPKYNSRRAVPIPEHVYRSLRRVIDASAPDNLVFYSDAGKDRPLSKSVIEKQFYRALERIGIAAEERKERNITVHSYRHKLNTLLRSRGVPDSKIRILTGHRSTGMTDWYTRYVAEDFADVLDVQATILPFRGVAG